MDNASAMVAPADAGASTVAPQTILIASTSWWAFPARIAMRFAALGFRVEAICHFRHPLRFTRAVSRVHAYGVLRPADALVRAMAAAAPVLVVPCDDRAAADLRAVHARARGKAPEIAALVEQSLGDPSSYEVVTRRARLIAMAREESVPAPEMIAVTTEQDLRDALATLGLPAIMKVDGTWGGLGVAIVRSLDEARSALRAMSAPLNTSRALKRLLVDRDPYHLHAWTLRERPVVNVQRLVSGRPANCLVACWRGETLAVLGVDVVVAQHALGASTVVRAVDNPAMTTAARRLVARLGLSGFCGLDFMVDEETGATHLIELNPRTTPICHLALDAGRDPVGALATRLTGAPVSHAPPAVTDLIAFFPQAWHHDPQSPYLARGLHDVPWAEPALVHELMRAPWPDRGMLARVVRSARRRLRNR